MKDKSKLNFYFPHRIFIDMDGVMVDFEGYMIGNNLTAEQVKNKPNAYFEMLPIKGAIESIRELLKLNLDIRVATKAPTGNYLAYADKVRWILEWIPELKRDIILTHDKGLLGNENDYLIDDRIHKANCMEFKGTIIHFGQKAFDGQVMDWKHILGYFQRLVMVFTPDEL